MMKLVVLALAAFGASALECSPSGPTVRDIHRARNKVQTARLGGKDHHEIAHKINSALESSDLPQKDCMDFTMEELNQLLRDMHCHFNEHLSNVYEEGDGRKRRLSTLDEYEASWVAELEKLANDATLLEPLLHAKCAETLMLWAHHTPAGSKDTLVHEQGAVLPTLPTFNSTHTEHEDEHVAKTYASSYTCQTGHGMTEASTTGSDHVLPHWDTNHHYTGTGYGAYPFWLGGEGEGGTSPIEVWWSEEQAAELFYHETCYMDEAGYGSGSTPCYHLMTGVLGEAKAYLYSADGNFCCESTGQPQDLAPPQSDFMDDMTLAGVDTLTTAYYSGQAYHYTMTLSSSQPVTAFWYYTTPEGLPLQQGEGGYGPTDPSGAGIFIYHEYNYTSWEAEAGESIDSSKFDIPSVCSNTRNTCQFP